MGQRVGLGPTRVGHPADGDGRGDGPAVLPEVKWSVTAPIEAHRWAAGRRQGRRLARSAAAGTDDVVRLASEAELSAQRAAEGHICRGVSGTVGDGGGRMPGLPDAVRHRRVAVRPPTTSFPSVFQRSTPEAPRVRGRSRRTTRSFWIRTGWPHAGRVESRRPRSWNATRSTDFDGGARLAFTRMGVTETRSPEGRTHNGTSGAGEQSTEAWIEPGGRDPCQLCTATPAIR